MASHHMYNKIQMLSCGPTSSDLCPSLAPHFNTPSSLLTLWLSPRAVLLAPCSGSLLSRSSLLQSTAAQLLLIIKFQLKGHIHKGRLHSPPRGPYPLAFFTRLSYFFLPSLQLSVSLIATILLIYVFKFFFLSSLKLATPARAGILFNLFTAVSSLPEAAT